MFSSMPAAATKQPNHYLHYITFFSVSVLILRHSITRFYFYYYYYYCYCYCYYYLYIYILFFTTTYSTIEINQSIHFLQRHEIPIIIFFDIIYYYRSFFSIKKYIFIVCCLFLPCNQKECFFFSKKKKSHVIFCCMLFSLSQNYLLWIHVVRIWRQTKKIVLDTFSFPLS